MSERQPLPEVWLRGPVDGVPALLQPVAHALLHAREEVSHLVAQLSVEELWRDVAGAAPVGFHLRHMTGSLDRLLTYARGEQLDQAQRDALAAEKEGTRGAGAAELLEEMHRSVERALDVLRGIDVRTLGDPRSVGRAHYPSTVVGLLYHAGEHAARHAGQVSTTVKVLRELRAGTV